MTIEIREMRGDDEARELRRVGRRAFHPVFSLILPKPKWAYGLFEDGVCLGGVILKQIGTIGLVDWIFLSKAARGRGLAKRLVVAALDAFAEQGLTKVAALVRDDNTASWNLFAARGLKAVTPLDLIRQLGIRDAVRISFASNMVVAYGFDLWLGSLEDALDPSAPEHVSLEDTASGNFLTTLLWHLSLNLLPAIAVVWRHNESPVYWAIALSALILGRLLFAYLGTIPLFRRVRLRAGRGGYIIAVPNQLLGGLLFHPAFWHPAVPRWREPDCRSGLGVSASLGVIGTMGLIAVSSLLLARGTLQSTMAIGIAGTIVQAGKLILIMELQPLFEAWSGRRILRWSLIAYFAVLAAGVAVIIWA